MIEIIVPATSANMGPGFDCLGIALNMYNRFFVEEISSGLDIQGCEEAFRNESNLIYLSMKKCFEKIKYHPRGIRIIIESEIPVSRGLGSSAACIVGGVLGANAIAGNVLSTDELLKTAAQIEGHPDNVAPALLGGMIISISEGGKFYYDKIRISEGLKFCALIPDFTLSTKESRAVLPSNIPYKDAVHNVSRAALMVTAISNGNFGLIKHACTDRLHQPYRGSLIANYEDIVYKAEEFGCLGVFLSGAGPTIMTIIKNYDEKFSKNMSDYLSTLPNKWILKELYPDLKGAIVKNP